MTEITLNELLPKRIRKIHTGSELLLAYELGKYTRIMLGKELTLDVTIAKELLQSEHFTFVVQNGLNVGFTPDRETLLDISKNARYFFKGTVEGVAFKSESPEEVVYDFNFNQRANEVLHYDNRSAAYISLLAYLIVKAKAEGVSAPKLRISHMDYNHKELEYVDLFILMHYGNKLFEESMVIEYSKNWGYQPEWEAFVIYHRQRGSMNREYTSVEKYKHLRKNFEVGDVVLLYKRSKPSQGKTINLLKSCFPAVITYFDQNIVKLTYFPIVQTRFTRINDLSSVEQEIEEEGRKSLYSEEDYERFDRPTMTINITELGVDTHTWAEQDFFIKPIDFDGSMQYFKTPTGSTHIHISTLDTIYAVFEDQGVEYNRDKFLAEYFGNRQPIYDYYKQLMEEHSVQ